MFSTIDSLGVEYLVIDLRHNGGGNSVMGNLLLSHCALPDSVWTWTGAIRISNLMLERYNMDINQFRALLAAEIGKDLPDFELPHTFRMFDQGKAKQPYYMLTNVRNEEDKKLYAGKLILLIGNDTFSSAVMFATDCSDNALAALYGQPTGGKPSTYGDILGFRLPHTGIVCRVSHKYFQRPDLSRDPADSLYPDVMVTESPDEYFSSGDAVWNKVLLDISQDAVP
jgi:hypothetical protein